MPNRGRYHLTVIAALLGLSCLVQVLMITRAVLPGLDAVRFVDIAQSIENEGLLATAIGEREQPLFPAWVCLVHRLRVGISGESVSTWATSVQIAAAVPLILSIVPLYLTLLCLVGPNRAAAACIFFCLLPEVARLGADGLSDSTHLLFFCITFWAIVEYLQGTRVFPWLLLAGVSAGVAILARAEVLVLIAAMVVAALAFQLQPRRRLAWSRLAVAAGVFSLGLAVVLGPYLAVVGATTPQVAMARILGRFETETQNNDTSPTATEWRLADGTPMAFTVREPNMSIRHRGFAAAIVRFVRKLADAYGYWIGVLALLGVWLLRGESMRRVDRFVQIFFVLFSLLAIRFTAREGYLDARHLLPLVVVGIGCAGYGGLWLGEKLAHRLRWKSPAAAWLVVLLAAVACLPQLLVPLHHSRQAHRMAAEWLADEAETPGAVLDTHGWTGMYSGRKTYDYTDARRAFSDPQLSYVVVEVQEFRHDSDRARTLSRLMQLAGEPVARFPLSADGAANCQPVVVYRWHPGVINRK
jgi:hypothetical protein